MTHAALTIVTEYVHSEWVKLLSHLPYRTEEKGFDKVENLARDVQAAAEGIPKEDYEISFRNATPSAITNKRFQIA